MATEANKFSGLACNNLSWFPLADDGKSTSKNNSLVVFIPASTGVLVLTGAAITAILMCKRRKRSIGGVSTTAKEAADNTQSIALQAQSDNVAMAIPDNIYSSVGPVEDRRVGERKEEDHYSHLSRPTATLSSQEMAMSSVNQQPVVNDDTYAHLNRF